LGIEIEEVRLDFWHSEVIPDAGLTAEAKKYSFWRAFWDVIETVLISLALFFAINYVTARIRVESISMEPNLYAGDFVIVSKLAYRFDEPTRGDVIVFKYPPRPNETPYIKRVIGLPGDDVEIRNGYVFINGELLPEPYIQVDTYPNNRWMVPEDALFVMGDNRENSSDSRSWGMVPLENVIGKAEVVYWPPEDWKILHIPSAAAAQP
jgi:signal peptidase I